jgi:hypothetical protein
VTYTSNTLTLSPSSFSTTAVVQVSFRRGEVWDTILGKAYLWQQLGASDESDLVLVRDPDATVMTASEEHYNDLEWIRQQAKELKGGK